MKFSYSFLFGLLVVLSLTGCNITDFNKAANDENIESIKIEESNNKPINEKSTYNPEDIKYEESVINNMEDTSPSDDLDTLEEELNDTSILDEDFSDL